SAYDEAPALLEGEGIDDRAVDLWSPLVAVTHVADLEDAGRRTQELLHTARELGVTREADADAGSTARLLEALEASRAGQGETIAPADLLSALRSRPGWEWLTSGRRLAGLLHPVGIARRQLWNGGRRRWCYVLAAGQLTDLRVRYGAGGEELAADPAEAPAA